MSHLSNDNPFALLSDICRFVENKFATSLQSSPGMPFVDRTVAVADSIDTFANLKEALASVPDADTQWFDETGGLPCLQERPSFGIRAFCKDFGSYLCQIESGQEFQNDPFYLRYMYSARFQKGIREMLNGRHTDVEEQKTPGWWAGKEGDLGLVYLTRNDFEEKREEASKATIDTKEHPWACEFDSFEMPDAGSGPINDVYVRVEGRYYEIWMEAMAACCCVLSLLGRRYEEPWTRCLELAEDRTHGIPGGVCSYKYAGDIYRKMTRYVVERDARFFEGDRFTHSIIHFSANSVLLREDTDESDLTPMYYRRIGAMYFKMHLLTHLQELRKSNPEPGLNVHDGKRRTVAYLFQKEELNKVLTNPTNDAWWLPGGLPIEFFCLNTAQRNVFPCILGIDKGVYFHSSTQDLENPYTMRSTTDDYHDSFRGVFSSILPEQNQDTHPSGIAAPQQLWSTGYKYQELSPGDSASTAESRSPTEH